MCVTHLATRCEFASASHLPKPHRESQLCIISFFHILIELSQPSLSSHSSSVHSIFIRGPHFDSANPSSLLTRKFIATIPLPFCPNPLLSCLCCDHHFFVSAHSTSFSCRLSGASPVLTQQHGPLYPPAIIGHAPSPEMLSNLQELG